MYTSEKNTKQLIDSIIPISKRSGEYNQFATTTTKNISLRYATCYSLAHAYKVVSGQCVCYINHLSFALATFYTVRAYHLLQFDACQHSLQLSADCLAPVSSYLQHHLTLLNSDLFEISAINLESTNAHIGRFCVKLKFKQVGLFVELSHTVRIHEKLPFLHIIPKSRFNVMAEKSRKLFLHIFFFISQTLHFLCSKCLIFTSKMCPFHVMIQLYRVLKEGLKNFFMCGFSPLC